MKAAIIIKVIITIDMQTCSLRDQRDDTGAFHQHKLSLPPSGGHNLPQVPRVNSVEND
jgi:hypothetical protein